MLLNRIKRNALALLMALSVLSLPFTAFASDLHNDALQAILEREVFIYSATYGKDTAIGELEVRISSQGDSVSVTTRLRITNALARLFLDEYIIQNRFHIAHGQLYLVSGEASKPGSEDVFSSYAVDRERGMIQYSDQESIPVPVDAKLDIPDFPIVLSTSVPESLAGTDVLVVSHKKASLYQYDSPQEETIVLQGKHYHALKVTRSKSGEEDRWVSVWLTNDEKRTPLRIVSSKRGKDSVFELKAPLQADSP